MGSTRREVLPASIPARHRDVSVRASVLLPVNSAAAHTGILPAFTIAQGSALRMAAEYPGEFIAFTLADPRKGDCARTLSRNLGAGCRGFGELELPVLIHFEHNAANMGFERFYRVVEKYPGVNFIGHAQTWWGNIDRLHRQEQVWPEPGGPVTPGGITDRLLSDYPNVFGDLSASSGLNALTRDREYMRGFLDRHRDKLLFGSDCMHKGFSVEGWDGHGCWARQSLRALYDLAPSREVLTKILRANARGLLGLV